MLDFQSVTKLQASNVGVVKAKPAQTARQEPPDVEQLGRSSWTLLHSIAAKYPENPDDATQKDMSLFVKLFGKFYPCWYCADDFNKYVEKNKPEVTDLESFGKWLCRAHNDVNKKLGKPVFDCNLWKKRWRDGWDEE